MKCRALASDYDGTLAAEGRVDKQTLDALRRFRESGRELFLVTGRQVDELLGVFFHAELFGLIVAENGGLLYHPATRETQLLGEHPPQAFLDLLRHRGVQPLDVGQVIVATREPQHTTVLEAIHELGLELHVTFNKGAVMVLPSGINKATGLKAALKQRGLSPTEVVAVGDGENDHALLNYCGLSVAVANAVPALQERADWVTPSPAGAGVVQLVERMLAPKQQTLPCRAA